MRRLGGLGGLLEAVDQLFKASGVGDCAEFAEVFAESLCGCGVRVRQQVGVEIIGKIAGLWGDG